MSSSTRGIQALVYLMWPEDPGLGVTFKKVSPRDLQLGDIVLFPLDQAEGAEMKFFKHAAVCCGNKEVIHFQGDHSKIGVINKEGFLSMRKKRGYCQVYRKKGSINVAEFQDKVEEAMNSIAIYDLQRNNCIHFALHLLGLYKFYKKPATRPKEGPRK